MKAITSCIEGLRVKLDRHRKDQLKEYPTRAIFIDPLLQSLGWDVRDPDEVELEYQTVDAKQVDYALKINRKPVLFIEAKPLHDALLDVKAITQVVGYAANAGVEWCILTNGATYKVYHSTEKAEAPEKLLYQVSIDPKETEGMSVQQVAQQFARFSRDAMARGILDELGEQVFTTGKIRKALDKLLLDPPTSLIRLIRATVADETVKPMQVKEALRRIWTQTPEAGMRIPHEVRPKPAPSAMPELKAEEYSEEYHVKGKPREVVELFRTIDKFCRELEPDRVRRMYLKKYIKYSCGKNIFCCVHVQKSGLRVWLKLKYSDLESPPEYARDVSNVGHWGVGDLELVIDSLTRFQTSSPLIERSFEENKPSE